MLNRLSRLSGLGIIALYIALLDRARDNRSLGNRHDMTDSRSPYSRSIRVSGQAGDVDAVVAGFAVTAPCESAFVVAAFPGAALNAFFREDVSVSSPVARLRFIPVSSALIICHSGFQYAVVRMVTGWRSFI